MIIVASERHLQYNFLSACRFRRVKCTSDIVEMTPKLVANNTLVVHMTFMTSGRIDLHHYLLAVISKLKTPW